MSVFGTFVWLGFLYNYSKACAQPMSAGLYSTGPQSSPQKLAKS